MRVALLTVALLIATLPAAEGQRSTWWHGRFVNAGIGNCDTSDSLTVFSSEEVRFWESSCEVTQQVDLRDMRGVLLDLRSCWAEGEAQDDDDRLLVIELSNGHLLRYSAQDESTIEMKRCSDD